jgi:HK97 family phage prohead protease
MSVERRHLSDELAGIEVRENAAGVPVVTGYAAVFYRAGNPGTLFALQLRSGVVWERFLPGAFDEAIRRDDVRCLFNHRSDNVLGRNKAETLTLTVDERGLRYECLLPDTSCGRDLRVSLARRDITGSSLGMHVGEDEEIVREGDRLFRNIRSLKQLFDVGPVTFPAYEATSSGVALRSVEQFEDAERRTIAAARRRRAALARLR